MYGELVMYSLFECCHRHPLAVNKLTEELANGPAHGSGSTGGQVSRVTEHRAGGRADFWEIERAGGRLILAIMNTSLNGNLSTASSD